MKVKLLCLLIVCFAVSFCREEGLDEENANLSFEKVNAKGMPTGWSYIGRGFRASVDKTTHQLGTKSLLLESYGNDTANSYYKFYHKFMLAYEPNMKVTLSASIKTENLERGFASLWVHLNDYDSVLFSKGLDNMDIRGTTDWKRYSYEFTIPFKAKFLSYGIIVNGAGKAWFDDVKLEINGGSFAKYIYYNPGG